MAKDVESKLKIMLRRFCWMSFLVLSMLLVACGTDDEPRATEFVIVTPAATQVDVRNYERTIVALETENASQAQTIEAFQSPDTSPTIFDIATPELPPTTTPLPTETVRPSAFPTPRVEIVSVVEQIFERGRMIWFRDTRRIAVLIGDEVDPTQGTWLCFTDTFQEGDVEFLPTLQPPPNTTTTSQFPDVVLQQPIRGFGNIWRMPEVRDEIGWAVTSELEHSAVYEYIAGGVLEGNDVYVPGPGEYRLQSFYDGAIILLYETDLDSDCPSGTWTLRRPR